MAIQVVQTSVSRRNSGSDTTLTLTGVVPGNVLIAFGYDGLPTLSPGYTSINTVYAYKVAASSSESYTFYNLNNGVYAPVYLAEVSGVSTTNPVVDNIYTNDSNSATSMSLTDWTTTDANIVSLAFFAGQNTVNGTIPPAGSLPTYTLKGTFTFTQTANSVRYEIFSKELALGSHDATYTTSGTNNILGETLLLRPQRYSQQQLGNAKIEAVAMDASSSGIGGGYGTFGFGGMFGGEVLSSGSTTVDQTQTGNARISLVTDQTIQGNSRISTTVDRTIQGNARIRKAVTRTIIGNARIVQTVDRVQTGNARIGLVTDRDITGNALIESLVISTEQTIQGNARIRKAVYQEQDGNAAIQRTTDQDITGNANVSLRTERSIMGTARIVATVERTQVGNGRIEKSEEHSIAGNARIQVTSDRTQVGTARIHTTVLQTQTGTARIQLQTSKDQVGRAQIVHTIDRNITGSAYIYDGTELQPVYDQNAGDYRYVIPAEGELTATEQLADGTYRYHLDNKGEYDAGTIDEKGNYRYS